jgi:phage terminase large subunit-like protein
MSGACRRPSFRNLILNQRVGTTEQFLNAVVEGLRCAGRCRQLNGRSCFAGLDLGVTKDITALMLVFVDQMNDSFDALPFCWLPGETLQEREHEDATPYRLWARQGMIEDVCHHAPMGATSHGDS